MSNEHGKRKPIPESRIALLAGAILLGALVLYALNALLPNAEPDPASPVKTPAATPISDENGAPLPIDCYVPKIEGTSIVLLSSDGKSMLIDAGYASDASTVTEQLRSLGIERLDAAFLTSADAFAIGGMAEALASFPPEAFYVSAHITNNAGVSELIGALTDNGTQVHAVNADFVSTVDWAENAELRILSPYNAEYPESADNALVLRLAYGSSRITVLGGAGALAGRMMVKALPNRLLHSDVLFVTDTGRAEEPYEKYFDVSKAGRYVMKRFSDSGGTSPLGRFLEKKGLIPLESENGLHLVLDGAEVKEVKY